MTLLASYVQASSYFGALIGRYGNRIARSRFTLDSTHCVLVTNDGPNALHGGVKGFDEVVCTVTRATMTATGPRLAVSCLSKDGEEGYPGNLTVAASIR